MRRAQKEKSKNPTYNLTEAQLEALVKEKLAVEFKEELQFIRRAAADDAMNKAIVLTLSLPMKVLMDHYWPKSYKKKIPEFTKHLMQYFYDWQDGKYDIEQLRKEIWENAGVRLQEEN
jgi:hypothetical protein